MIARTILVDGTIYIVDMETLERIGRIERRIPKDLHGNVMNGVVYISVDQTDEQLKRQKEEIINEDFGTPLTRYEGVVRNYWTGALFGRVNQQFEIEQQITGEILGTVVIDRQHDRFLIYRVDGTLYPPNLVYSPFIIPQQLYGREELRTLSTRPQQRLRRRRTQNDTTRNTRRRLRSPTRNDITRNTRRRRLIDGETIRTNTRDIEIRQLPTILGLFGENEENLENFHRNRNTRNTPQIGGRKRRRYKKNKRNQSRRR